MARPFDSQAEAQRKLDETWDYPGAYTPGDQPCSTDPHEPHWDEYGTCPGVPEEG